MNIPITSGRNFREEDTRVPGGAFILNETARKAFELEAGEYISDVWISPDPCVIAGFTNDFKFASFRMNIGSMAFYVTDYKNYIPKYAYVKIKAGADIRETIKNINHIWLEIDPEFRPDISFYDTVLDHLYKKEKNISRIISLFSLLAIFISMVGVFGLVIFESEYKRKEIGIRKVLGSTTNQILILFNKLYLQILSICFVLAAPLSYYAITRWLENFAYKIPIYWWGFLAAFVMVASMTILTVTFQNWRAANANPVDSIKAE